MPTTYGPKKPSTSYFMFMAATREKVKAKNPEASTTQLSRVLGEQWRALTPEAKAVFEQKAADDKIRYQKEYERWVVEHPEEVALQNAAKEDKKRGKKRSKEEGAPKRALTAYIYFTNAVRAETKKDAPDAKITELSKIMGAKWKALTEAQKAPYIAMSEKDKARYKKEKAIWDKQVAVKRQQLEVQQQQQAQEQARQQAQQAQQQAMYQQQVQQQQAQQHAQQQQYYAQPQYAQPQYAQQYAQQTQPQYAQQVQAQYAQQVQYAPTGYQQQPADLGWWQ